MATRDDRARSDFLLSPAQRADARAALRVLEGSGLSLEQAALRAVDGARAVARVSFGVLADRFLLSVLKSGRRPRTVEWYEHLLGRLVGRFGRIDCDDIDRASFRAWLEAMPGSASTRASYVRCLRAVWSWGAAQEPPLTAEARCPAAGLAATAQVARGGAEFFTVAECAAMLSAAGRYRNALAMLLFTGIRPGELAGKGKPRLAWSHVQVSERLVRIPGDLSKTGSPRIIEGTPETLWHWLQPGQPHEPVCASMTEQVIRTASRAISRPWPHDGTRHTFATYALAETSDVGKVSVWLGHEGSPTMLHRHYRGLATRAEAAAFWALRPGVIP